MTITLNIQSDDVHPESVKQVVAHDGLTFTKLGDWSIMTPERWHDSLYFAGSFFWDLKAETEKYCRDVCQKWVHADPEQCNFVEVGCGTGDIMIGVAADFHHSIGLDINGSFVDYAERQTPPEVASKCSWITGSATELNEIVKANVPLADGKHGPMVVCCVNNTIGVFPDCIKETVYSEMKSLAGESGIIVVGFWNGNCFGQALQHFYAKQSQLCGSLEGAGIDWVNTSLQTKGGYHTKWTKPEEARDVLTRNGFEVLDVSELSVGVLCTCRGQASA